MGKTRRVFILSWESSTTEREELMGPTPLQMDVNGMCLVKTEPIVMGYNICDLL